MDTDRADADEAFADESHADELHADEPHADELHADEAFADEAFADEAFAAKTIRSFIRDGRLASIPAREKRRQVIYRYLRDQVFTEDREYEEREVNQRLALFHPDVATIRRGMVDARLVTREGGIYRRTP